MARPKKSLLSLLAVLSLAGCASAAAAATGTGTVALTAAQAPASTVPPAPAGWTRVFADDFHGSAGKAPSSANWFHVLGTGFDMGAVQQATNSVKNAYLDGKGDLVLQAFRGSNGTWQSARLESTRSDFKAPAGGALQMTASIKLPSVANGLGYWPAFAALGAPKRTGGQWPAIGEIDMMEDINGMNGASQALHDAAGSTGHYLANCAAGGCLSGYHTFSAIVNRTNTSAEFLKFLIDGKVIQTITEKQVGVSAWQQAIDHGFYFVLDLSLGGTYPDQQCGCSTPTGATASGGSMSVGYVAVYEAGGNSTPKGKATKVGHLAGYQGLCLANQNSLNVMGNPIAIRSCASLAGESWSVYSDGTLRVQGGCLDDVAGSTSSGSWLDWYPCNGTGDQQWSHKANGEVVNPRTGLCLADPLGDTSSRIVIETCNDDATQRWTYPS